jgi:hypothetical protein
MMRADMNFAEARANREASKKFKALCELSIREEHRLMVLRMKRAANELNKRAA